MTANQGQRPGEKEAFAGKSETCRASAWLSHCRESWLNLSGR